MPVFRLKGGIITTGFVEIVPVTPRPSLSSLLRIIRALTFFVAVNRMNMNETSVETCRMASVMWLLTKHEVLQPCIRNAIRQLLWTGTQRQSVRSSLLRYYMCTALKYLSGYKLSYGTCIVFMVL